MVLAFTRRHNQGEGQAGSTLDVEGYLNVTNLNCIQNGQIETNWLRLYRAATHGTRHSIHQMSVFSNEKNVAHGNRKVNNR